MKITSFLRAAQLPALALAAGALFLLPLAAAHAQEAQPTAVEKPKPKQKSVLDLYFSGGFLMHPILLCSIGTIAVGAYCFYQMSKNKMLPDEQVRRTIDFMKLRDPGAAYESLQTAPSTFSRTMSSALLKVNFDRDMANKPAMEQSATETLNKEETRQMVWVNYLNVFATLAPMLGLLGTVTGMIEAFDQLSAGLSEPQDLAGGIGVAMLTTAGGLIVGIPAMFLYFFFRSRLVTLISDVQEKVTFAIDLISGELQIEEAVEHAQHLADADAQEQLA